MPPRRKWRDLAELDPVDQRVALGLGFGELGGRLLGGRGIRAPQHDSAEDRGDRRGHRQPVEPDDAEQQHAAEYQHGPRRERIFAALLKLRRQLLDAIFETGDLVVRIDVVFRYRAHAAQRYTRSMPALAMMSR